MTAVATLTGALSDRMTVRRLQTRMVKVVSQPGVRRGTTAFRKGRLQGLSGMQGNLHVPFLGGWAGVIPPSYPAHAIPTGSTVPTLLNVELGDDQEVFGQHGTGVAHRGQLLQSGIKFAYLCLCVVPVWRVSRLAAGHAHTLSEGGQRGLPATAALLAFADGGSRLFLSAFAYNVRPTPVYFCIQALR
jgi:hypothetical protein